MTIKEAIKQLIEIKEYYTPERDFSQYGEDYEPITKEDKEAIDIMINVGEKQIHLKEKINQLQTYKLFQNDKETYLSKQDIIDLVSEIEREENANEEKEVIENKLKEIENNEQIYRNS